MLTGHCGLKNHIYKMKKTNISECLICGHEDENVSHFLGQCPAIAHLRGQHFNDYYYISLLTTSSTTVNHTRRLLILEPEALDTWGVT
jgi:hypothetical protein